jgi:hypothetical protein
LQKAAGEVSPPSRSLTDQGLAPALGLRADGSGFVIVLQAGSQRSKSMRLLSWLLQRTVRQHHNQAKQRHRPSRCRLQLEALEDRSLPSTLTVTTGTDSGPGSLRAEVAAAQSGDTIVISPNLAVLLTSGELAIDKSLTIDGPVGGVRIDVINSNSRAFDVTSTTASVSLDNLLVLDGLAPDGGAVMNAGSLMLNNCAFGNNGATHEGGALDNMGTATINNCFLGPVFGGGNFAIDGGAIENHGTMTLTGGAVGPNGAEKKAGIGNGGGIDNHGTLSVRGSAFFGGFAADNGGCIANFGTLTATGVLFGGSADNGGGSIANFGSAALDGCTLGGPASPPLSDDGFASCGGGVFNAGTMTISNSTMEGCLAASKGGGIYNAGTLILSATTVTNNFAYTEGGGIDNTGTLYVTNGSVVTGNSAPAGADLYNLGTVVISSDSTVGVIGP